MPVQLLSGQLRLCQVILVSNNGVFKHCWCQLKLISNIIFNKKYLADPGKARGCFTNTFVIHSFINSVSHPLVKYLYSAVTPRRLKMVLPVQKQNIFFQRFLILKGILIAVLVQKLRQFCWMVGFCPMVELHLEVSAPVGSNQVNH